MSGSGNMNMTGGDIRKQMLIFALPIFLGQLFQQLYSTADSVIVGRFIGKDALAAISGTESLLFMMTGFFLGLGLGAGVVVSRYFGAQDFPRVKTAVHTAVAFALICGGLLTVSAYFISPLLLGLMEIPAEILPLATEYFQIYFFGSIANFTFSMCMEILRAVGDSKNPLYYLIFSSVLNVGLDYLFVGVFGWGIWAAAVATVISQIFSAVLCIIRLCRTSGAERLEPKELRLNSSMLKELLEQGIPSGIQYSIINIANVVVQSNINVFGEDAMAGCGAYSKVEGFAFLPIMAFSSAITIFISQNLGAKQHNRAKTGARFGILCCIFAAEVIGIIVLIFSEPLTALFNSDPAVIQYGVSRAGVESVFFFLLALSYALAAVMRGAGMAKVPMYTMMIFWCGVRVTYITFAVRLFPQIQTIFWAYPLTWGLSSLLLLWYYFKTDWLHAFDS